MCSLRKSWWPGREVLGLAVLLLIAAGLSAQPTVKINEYVVGFPFDIAAGPDGAMWFTNLNSIGRITTSGAISTYPLPTKGREAVRIAAGPDGALWFTEISPDAIGRITIYGAITEYPLLNPASGVRGITSGPDGALWFTEWGGGKIGRITTTGAITEYPLPWYGSGDWITAGPDGALWFASGHGIGRITTSGIITEYLLPPPIPGWAEWSFTGITSGPDGALWVTEWVGHRILRVTTDGRVTTYDVPGCPQAGICADGITTGPDGALWFTLFSANSIGRITTTGAITEYPIPNPNSQSSGIATGPDGSIWFTEHAAGKIGVIVLASNVTKPISQVTQLPASEIAANFTVQWYGTDTGGPGLRDYSVYVSDTGGPFTPWLWQTTATRSTFAGTAGHSYGFYCIARDNALNQENPKTVADATTYVASAGIGDVNGDGQVNCADLAVVKASFGKRSGQTGFDPRADVNHDGVVDIRDLSLVSQQLVPGTKCQ